MVVERGLAPPRLTTDDSNPSLMSKRFWVVAPQEEGKDTTGTVCKFWESFLYKIGGVKEVLEGNKVTESYRVK